MDRRAAAEQPVKRQEISRGGRSIQFHPRLRWEWRAGGQVKGGQWLQRFVAGWRHIRRVEWMEIDPGAVREFRGEDDSVAALVDEFAGRTVQDYSSGRLTPIHDIDIDPALDQQGRRELLDWTDGERGPEFSDGCPVGRPV